MHAVLQVQSQVQVSSKGNSLILRRRVPPDPPRLIIPSLNLPLVRTVSCKSGFLCLRVIGGGEEIKHPQCECLPYITRIFQIQWYKTRDIPNKVCIVVVHNLILNCIFRIDLIHLNQGIFVRLLLKMNQLDSKHTV